MRTSNKKIFDRINKSSDSNVQGFGETLKAEELTIAIA